MYPQTIDPWFSISHPAFHSPCSLNLISTVDKTKLSPKKSISYNYVYFHILVIINGIYIRDLMFPPADYLVPPVGHVPQVQFFPVSPYSLKYLRKSWRRKFFRELVFLLILLISYSASLLYAVLGYSRRDTRTCIAYCHGVEHVHIRRLINRGRASSTLALHRQ